MWSLTVLLFGSSSIALAEADLGQTDRLQSKILNEERAIRVFLPASYGALASSRYPVLYMVDGDYHFHYLSGLLEQMSSISEQIPELILVAIDDKGKTNASVAVLATGLALILPAVVLTVSSMAYDPEDDDEQADTPPDPDRDRRVRYGGAACP